MPALTLPVGTTVYLFDGQYRALSEHNRQPISISTNRLEQVQRMSNGTVRKFYVADKLQLSISWSMLPSYSTFTVDEKWGALDIKNFYDGAFGKSSFNVKVMHGTGSTALYDKVMYFTGCSLEMVRRNANIGNITRSADITAASGSSGVITYTGSNNFVAGDKVTITGLESEQFNVTNATVTSANSSAFSVASQSALTFSISDAESSGSLITYYSSNTLNVGDEISITGFTNTAFNLTNVKVHSRDTYYFRVQASVAAGTEDGPATATIFAENTEFSISQFTPAANQIVYTTSANHDIESGDTVSISGIRSTATITNVEQHTTGGQIKFTAVNTFAVNDVIEILNVIPSGYNRTRATVLEATGTYFTIAGNFDQGKFRVSGIARSIYNISNVIVSSVTQNTFTVPLTNATGAAVTGLSGVKVNKSINYKATAISTTPTPQELWNLSITLEEV